MHQLIEAAKELGILHEDPDEGSMGCPVSHRVGINSRADRRLHFLVQKLAVT